MQAGIKINDFSSYSLEFSNNSDLREANALIIKEYLNSHDFTVVDIPANRLSTDTDEQIIASIKKDGKIVSLLSAQVVNNKKEACELLELDADMSHLSFPAMIFTRAVTLKEEQGRNHIMVLMNNLLKEAKKRELKSVLTAVSDESLLQSFLDNLGFSENFGSLNKMNRLSFHSIRTLFSLDREGITKALHKTSN